MSDLLEAINEYKHNHGHYPTMNLNPEFRADNWEDLTHLICDGIDFRIDETVDQWELE